MSPSHTRSGVERVEGGTPWLQVCDCRIVRMGWDSEGTGHSWGLEVSGLADGCPVPSPGVVSVGEMKGEFSHGGRDLIWARSMQALPGERGEGRRVAVPY